MNECTTALPSLVQTWANLTMMVNTLLKKLVLWKPESLPQAARTFLLRLRLDREAFYTLSFSFVSVIVES